MGDVRRATRKVKRKAARKAPKKRTNPIKGGVRASVKFTNSELKALNRNTTLLSIAQVLLEEVWAPIRQKYGISREIQYDRKTGKVS